MGISRISPVVAALVSAASVAAHGHVDHVVIDGLFYQGYDPTVFPYEQTPPTVVGWTTSQTDNGYVAPDSFGAADIICHKSATPAGGHAQVKAGDSISITWNTWPDSHKGPMLDYLAPCDGSCESVDKTTLKFFKIDEVGLIDYSATNGFWGSDELIKNNNTWLVQIPSNIKAGNYVLRHETIALHSAENADGAQAYPQCFNLEITGDGTEVPDGVLGTELYSATDPGILVNIYVTSLTYTIPGPTLIAGASSSVAQSSSAITATGTATVGSGSSATATSASAATTTAAQTSTAQTTAAASSQKTSTAAASTATPSSQKTSTAAASTSTGGACTAPTTLATSTRVASSTTLASTTLATTAVVTSAATTGAVSAQSLYGQCGGSNFAGPTACATGSCKSWNPYYYQCVNTA
ncbi:carbohydrate-binding module family 1 protein [Daldinia vernicosa]|uniref:carbohydrate-binding module family 1 protein n=1 Tax=Daldinia vernicosa TaxID=114800 RepID=UPI00200799DB|nr:carbohydrate-binding module family 1 protein [Daldinia vernicosa]KAI0844583.1 carbohydrate-binding module family 1 protein [Daldinia vernicosa]